MAYNAEVERIARQTRIGVHTHNICGYNLLLSTTEYLLWPLAQAVTLPSAAAATTIVSGDVKDDGAPAGVGAQQVYVSGLNSDWEEINEVVILNGTGAVTLANQYIRVGECYVIAAGSENDNAGRIDIKHSTTIIQTIAAGDNRTQTAIHSVPADSQALFAKLTLGTGKNDELIIRFKFKPFGLPIQTLHTEILNASSTVIDPVIPKSFPAKSDFFVTVQMSSGSNGQASALMCAVDVQDTLSRIRGQ